MKNSLIISLLILSVGVCQGEYNYDNLVEINGVWYKKFSDESLTGKVYGYFGKEGKKLTKVYIGELVNGKKEGIWTWWYSTGTKIDEMTYKDGEPNGLYTYWNEDGKKESEGTYKDWKKDGKWTRWYENGQKMVETYKDGVLDGKLTYWYEH